MSLQDTFADLVTALVTEVPAAFQWIDGQLGGLLTIIIYVVLALFALNILMNVTMSDDPG